MKWDFVRAANLMWQVLVKVKNFISTSGFNLY